jgi:hypothetical protein
MLSKKFFAQMLTMSLACLLSLPAMAQAIRGQVRGITDQSGSVLPGAKVTLFFQHQEALRSQKGNDSTYASLQHARVIRSLSNSATSIKSAVSPRY